MINSVNVHFAHGNDRVEFFIFIDIPSKLNNCGRRTGHLPATNTETVKIWDIFIRKRFLTSPTTY